MKNRLSSLDIFRALTMLLMIFVNDLWTIHGIPSWLEHAAAHDDGMGLADVVFPAFLFIVGLSVPFATENRLSKGESPYRVFFHILQRSLALIIMGFFMVNRENFNHQVPEFNRTLWEILMIVAFFLIWNNYPVKRIAGKMPVWVLQATGMVILIILALLFKGGTAVDPHWMRPHWWGILGLIGWAYLLCAGLYLVFRNRILLLFISFVLLNAMNLAEVMPQWHLNPHFPLVVSASNYSLVMSGILVAEILLKMKAKSHAKAFITVLVAFAFVCLVYGFMIRPHGGISKILATPAWTAICAGISMLAFGAVFLVADIAGKVKWAQIILPAGTSTLTCYLLPGLLYPVVYPLERMLPDAMLSGITGLLKCLLFALITIVLTGWLQKIHIRMKI